jgi:hypothetical protein
MEKGNGERYPCRWTVDHQSRSTPGNITSETLVIFVWLMLGRNRPYHRDLAAAVVAVPSIVTQALP